MLWNVDTRVALTLSMLNDNGDTIICMLPTCCVLQSVWLIGSHSACGYCIVSDGKGNSHEIEERSKGKDHSKGQTHRCKPKAKEGDKETETYHSDNKHAMVEQDDKDAQEDAEVECEEPEEEVQEEEEEEEAKPSANDFRRFNTQLALAPKHVIDRVNQVKKMTLRSGKRKEMAKMVIAFAKQKWDHKMFMQQRRWKQATNLPKNRRHCQCI